MPVDVLAFGAAPRRRRARLRRDARRSRRAGPRVRDRGPHARGDGDARDAGDARRRSRGGGARSSARVSARTSTSGTATSGRTAPPQLARRRRRAPRAAAARPRAAGPKTATRTTSAAGRLVARSVLVRRPRGLETGLPPHRPDQVVFYAAYALLQPTFLVDVSASFETKLSALRAYRSQFHDRDSGEPETYVSSKGFFDGIEARARALGRIANVEYAEGLRLERAAARSRTRSAGVRGLRGREAASREDRDHVLPDVRRLRRRRDRARARLARRGHDVHFITYALPSRLTVFAERVTYHEVTVPSYPLFQYAPLRPRARDADGATSRSTQRLDLIHVHYALPHAISALPRARDARAAPRSPS